MRCIVIVCFHLFTAQVDGLICTVALLSNHWPQSVSSHALLKRGASSALLPCLRIGLSPCSHMSNSAPVHEYGD